MRARHLVVAALVIFSAVVMVDIDRRSRPVVDPRVELIRDAARGVERSQLVERWRRLGTDDGRRVAALYEQLLSEDATIATLSSSEVAALEPAKRAAYWFERLRDARAWPVWSPEKGWPVDDPAVAIGELGWAAVPLLIAHFDDERPTRTLHESGLRLWTHGDYCRLLLNSTAAVQFSDRSAAELWWSEAEKGGEEKHFLAVLERSETPFRSAVAANNLLRIDEARYLPVLKAHVKKDLARHAELLDHLASRLGEEYEQLLASGLETRRLEDLAPVARTLRARCRSERGARRLLEVLSTWKPEEQSAAGRGYAGWATAYVARSRPMTPEVVDGYLGLMKSADPEVRGLALESAWRLPDPRVLDRLAELLADTSAAGAVRVCDRAASCLIYVLRLGAFDLQAPLEKRDAALRRLEAFYREKRATLDWPKIERDVGTVIQSER